jgi:hypothetical protein
MILYSLDSTLFIDQEATDLADNGKNIPKKGIPTSYAQAYSIHSLLWGDY